MPSTLILTARVGSIHKLIPIDRVSIDDYRQCGTCDRLETNRHLAKIEKDIRHDFADLCGNRVQRKRVAIACEEIRRQDLIACAVICFIQNAIIEARTVGTSREDGGSGNICRDPVMPLEILKGNI